MIFLAYSRGSKVNSFRMRALSEMHQIVLCVQDVFHIFELLDLLVPCLDNEDKKFLSLIRSRNGSCVVRIGCWYRKRYALTVTLKSAY